MQPTLLYLGAEEAIGLAVAAASADDELIWHPFIPLGDFNHPVYGPFSVTPEILAAMIANFNEGLPFTAGIPIDEDGLHQVRAEGAFGWVEALEVRDNALHGGIRWTSAGRDAISDRRFKFLSAHFSLAEHPFYHRPNLLFAAALCTRPFFRTQPELQVAATEYQPSTGGATSMTAPEAREQAKPYLGELTEEEWAEVAKDVTDWDAFLADLGKKSNADELPVSNDDLASAQAEIDRLKAELAALSTEKQEAVAATTTYGTQIAALQARLDEAEFRSIIAVTNFGPGVPAPAAIDVMATAYLHPTRESVQALYAYLEANKGKLPTVVLGENIALTTAVDPEEQWLASHPIEDRIKDRVRALAGKHKVGLREAYTLYLDGVK